LVERDVPNVNVEGSNPFARLFSPSLPDGVFCCQLPPIPRPRVGLPFSTIFFELLAACSRSLGGALAQGKFDNETTEGGVEGQKNDGGLGWIDQLLGRVN
jgi:hypothetical protein